MCTAGGTSDKTFTEGAPYKWTYLMTYLAARKKRITNTTELTVITSFFNKMNAMRQLLTYQ